MSRHPQRNARFFASTRGKMVLLLRRANRTVEELAHILGLTDNAIRAQMATLERDGLVQESGRRPSGSKPASVYTLTPAAEDLFPKAYGLVFRQLLQELNEHMPAGEVEAVLRATGRRLADQWPRPQGDLRVRLEAGVSLLNALGGLAELDQRNGIDAIQGYSCPLAAVVPGHPEVCRLAETLLTELVGAPIQARCTAGEAAQCCFVVLSS